MDRRIGWLFPVGGPVPPDLVIGRAGDIHEIERRLREGLHTMLVGPRRIGKTTVCGAACARLRADGATVLDVEVPERPDAASLLQLIVDRCNRVSLASARRRALRAGRPFVERLLDELGIPLDLGELGADPGGLPVRTIMSLPRALAETTRQPVVLFLDELQRATSYVDGDQVLHDLVDLYGGSSDVTVLVDGSDERVLSAMLGAPVHFGKLCDRLSLDSTIPRDAWETALGERFERAGLRLEAGARDLLLDFGSGRPYETMAAARYAALATRKLQDGQRPTSVGEFEAQMGIDEARRHLGDDGAQR
jgi:AAA ATPase-like protein